MRRHHRPDQAAAPLRDDSLTRSRKRRMRSRHGSARRAADRRHAAYGIALAMRADPSDRTLAQACARAGATRPTAINLRWAIERHAAGGCHAAAGARARPAPMPAPARSPTRMSPINRAIGRHGLPLIEAAGAQGTGEPSRSSPIAMPAGLPPSIGARRSRPSISRTIAACRPCLGRRDAAAQSRREAHRLGAGRAWRDAHHHRRQCRRASDAARAVDLVSSAPTAPRRRAMSPTRSAPI